MKGAVQLKVTRVPTGTMDAEETFATSVGVSVTLGLIDNCNIVNHGIDLKTILSILI